MRRLLLCTVAIVALAAGLDPRADLPRIGNCRTLPNQAACLGGLGGLAVGDVPRTDYLRFWSGSPTTQRMRLRWDGLLTIWPDADGFVPGGRSLECRYEGPEAETLIVGLNRANLSTMSLEKRVIQKCQTDGKLGAGTISGVPGS